MLNGVPYGSPQPMPMASSGKATGAVVCGVLAILLSWMPLVGIVLGIVAIVLAGKAVKEAGKNGKTSGGKVCGIVGIVLSVLAVFAYIAMGLGLLLYAASSEQVVITEGDSAMEAPATEDESQMEAVAAAAYDQLKNKDAAAVQQIAADLDAGFEDALEGGLTELGVEPAAFAEWLLEGFSYELDGAYANSDGTGTVYANVTMRDAFVFAEAFLADAQAAVDAGELQGLDEAGAKARLGEIFQAAMDKPIETTEVYSSLELVKLGDSWSVDPESWSDEMEYLLGVY